MRSPLRKCDNVIHDGSAVRVVRLRAGEEAVIDPLGDNDVSELNIAEACVLEGVLDGLNLSLHNVGDLTVTNSVPRTMTFGVQFTRIETCKNSPEHEDSFGKTPVDIHVLPEGLGDAWLHRVAQLLGGILMEVSHGDEPREAAIDGGH